VIKVVLDTNVLLTAFGKQSAYRPIFDSLFNQTTALVVTNDMVFEYLEILTSRSSPKIATDVVAALLSLNDTVRVFNYIRWNLITTDPDDNKFVDAAVTGNADYLVSSDAHFNVLRTIVFPRVKVISPDELLQLLPLA
jgi:uncharacterized protein